VVELVRAAAELSDDIDSPVDDFTPVAHGHRDDYALAAGAESGSAGHGAIASGTGSVNWTAVPPGVFDAAEDTVDWHIEADGSGARAVVTVQLAGSGPSPEGLPVHVRSGAVAGTGVLDIDARATIPLADDQQRPVAESAAWNHDWRAAVVTVGAEVDEAAQTRDRIRALARARLAEPPVDAFLAEILAAEADY
jgi:hypothetical protein